MSLGSPTKKHLQFLDEINKNLAHPSTLRLPERGGSYMVDTGAFRYAIGAVLLQEQVVDGGSANEKKK